MTSTDLLVTGGAGFIGSNLCRALVEQGSYQVTVLDDLSTGRRANLDGLDVRFVEGSILDTEVLAELVRPGGVVVHLAALGSVPRSVKDPVRSLEVNTTGTLLVLEAARHAGAAHLVFASSSSVYGDSVAPAKHESLPVAPKSPYGASKLAAEALVLAYRQTYGLPVIAFRFFNVFGPRQAAGHAYAAVIPAFIDRALNGEPLEVHGDGKQSRDFTYVDTVCDTIIDAIERRVCPDGPVNLAFGGQVSLLELIELLSRELGQDLDVRHLEPRLGDIRHSQADPSRLLALFEHIKPVDVATGVAATIAWFEHQYRAG